MSSSYVRKTNSANCSTKSMTRAVSDIVEKKRNYREASSYYRISISALSRRVNELRETGDPLGSLKPVFTFEQEEELVRCLKEINVEARTDLIIRKMAYTFAVSYGRKNKFKKGMAGKCWLKYFLNRHPELSYRNTETGSVVPPSERDLSQGSIDPDNHEISEMEPTGKTPKELETNRTQMGQEVDFLNEDQPVSENEPSEDQLVSENEPWEDQPVSENEPSEDQPVSENEPWEDQPISENEPSEDQPVSENEPWEDQPVSENEPWEDQPVSENEPWEDQPVSENETSEDQLVSENEPWEDQPISENEPYYQPLSKNEPSEDQPISENEPSEDESLHDPEITPIKIKHTEITDEFLSALNKSCNEFLLIPKISPQKLGMNCQNPERCSFDVDSAFKISFKDFTLQRKSFVKEREPPTWVTDPKPFRVRRGTMFNKRQIELSKDKAENDDQMKMMHCERIVL
ncbi:UNVERIFIED_CONTAM: hypothetical protein RMT77_015341 [Armadillidium vulgare]